MYEQIRWHRGRAKRFLLSKLPVGDRYQFIASLYNDFNRLKNEAIRLNADFYSLHCEPALFVADTLIKLDRPFSVDMEDWHSEDQVYGSAPEPYEALKKQELKVLAHSQFATTTSNALSDALAARFKTNRPTVIFNSFPDSDFVDGESNFDIVRPLRVVWFSQTIGHGRGIELLIDAAAKLTCPIEIHLRGNISDEYAKALTRRIENSGSKLNFHKLCLHHELDVWLKQHDIGFASELPNCESRNLTITNKILQYLQAGLVVLGTNTQGQKEVAANVPNSVKIVDHKSPMQLATLLEQFTKNRQKLIELRRKSRDGFDSSFEWSISMRKLASLFENAVSK